MGGREGVNVDGVGGLGSGGADGRGKHAGIVWIVHMCVLVYGYGLSCFCVSVGLREVLEVKCGRSGVTAHGSYVSCRCYIGGEGIFIIQRMISTTTKA